jgi:hypothetical protein
MIQVLIASAHMHFKSDIKWICPLFIWLHIVL